MAEKDHNEAGGHQGGQSMAGRDDDRAASGEAPRPELLSLQHVRKVVEDVREEARAGQLRHDAGLAAELRKRGPSRELLAALRRADRNDYEEWLLNYILVGGKPTRFHPYPFPRELWYVAETGFIAEEVNGPTAPSIIVPTGVRWSEPDELGDCNLYLWEDMTCQGGRVPIYEDMFEGLVVR
jgi:hypothetical protein